MINNTLLHKISNNQVARFILSAGMGFLVDVSAFYLFYHNLLTQKTYDVFGVSLHNSTISLALSFFMGVVVNFLITKYMVFNESTSKSSKQFIRFVLVATVGFFANWGVIKILIQDFDIYPPIARIMAALSLFLASFFVHKMFSFSLSLRHHTTK